MENVTRTQTEYGGFLPLELNQGMEYFAKYEPYLMRFNSVKAALDEIIKRIGKKVIYVPYYYCPSTTEAIRKTGTDICFYHVNEKLEPVGIPDEGDSVVLLVDYFGVRQKTVSEAAKKFLSADVIIDWAHDFFAEPVKGDRIHNIYSAKKFFGIPDGAYLVSNAVIPAVEAPTFAHGYMEYLVTAYEEGTNAAYMAKKDTDRYLFAHYGSMSAVSIGLLKNVDYECVRAKRTANYRMLYEAFKDTNKLMMPDDCAGYQFPLLIDNGRLVKQKLVDEKIYVSTLWSGSDLKENGNDFEFFMMSDAVFLPMDQRYDEEDMKYIVSRVKSAVEEVNGKQK